MTRHESEFLRNETCRRCGGSGTYGSIGTCFLCGGAGVIAVYKPLTPAQLADNAAHVAAEREAEEVAFKARQAARRAARAARKADDE